MALPPLGPPNSRERIYAALWDLVLSAPYVKATFNTYGRALVDLADVPREKMPALFMCQHGERHVKVHGLDSKRTMDASLVVYAWTPAQSQELPATMLNNCLDALDLFFEYPNNPSNVQTLNGLVDHVQIEGEVVIVEGQLATGELGSVMVVPLQIMLP